MKHISKWVFMLMMVGAVTACGKKGDLVSPDHSHAHLEMPQGVSL